MIVNAAHAGSLLARLQQVPDPRGAHGRRHSFSAMLATIVCAVLCGARGYEAIAQWVHAQEKGLWYLLGYFRTPPTGGAFRYLLSKIDPEALEAALRDWILDQIELNNDSLESLAINGKTLCSRLAEHGRSIQLLSLFDAKTGCVLSQMQVPTNTNEAKAALPILKSLVLEGRVVTGTQCSHKPIFVGRLSIRAHRRSFVAKHRKLPENRPRRSSPMRGLWSWRGVACHDQNREVLLTHPNGPLPRTATEPVRGFGLTVPGTPTPKCCETDAGFPKMSGGGWDLRKYFDQRTKSGRSHEERPP